MLSILIPTYNRIPFLLKNLDILSKIISDGGLVANIEIIISDNCSTDDTQSVIETYISKSNLHFLYFRQRQNIGLKNNALFVLSKSHAEYVMYLGDDDFISYEYLSACIRILEENKFTSVIIPNYIPISVTEQVLGPARDERRNIIHFNKGFQSVLKNSYKGHQLSGLILKREGLYDIYIARGVDNIYLFIFFISIWCLRGEAYHISDLPIRVTQPVEKKDWGYGEDGLVNEIFDNYKKLPVNYFQRFLLEIYFMRKNLIRLTMYKPQGLRVFIKAFYKITFAKNATTLFSLTFPFYVLKKRSFGMIKRVKAKLNFRFSS